MCFTHPRAAAARSIAFIPEDRQKVQMAPPIIKIASYDPQWPAEYRALADQLRKAAGSGIVALHHIGSTSVPGLAAKDVIDLQLTVASLEAWPHEKIEAAGFAIGRAVTEPVSDHCPPGLTLDSQELAKKFYKHRGRAAHLHVREAGRFNQRYPLLCRDYLRAHKLAAAAYAEIKLQLAKYFPHDNDAYYAIKDPTFDVLMSGAEDWAITTNWKQPPSD
jgi:GrpB-like predicted nucleotidyltransferase (UPF0157 family)